MIEYNVAIYNNDIEYMFYWSVEQGLNSLETRLDKYSFFLFTKKETHKILLNEKKFHTV